MIKSCKQCSNHFEALEKEVKRGHGLFCSISCAAKYNAMHRTKAEANVNCAYCAKPFYRSTSKKQNSRSGLYFCCRSHKDAAQRVGGISQIQPDHYGTGNTRYRDKALRLFGACCNRCGYDTHIAALVVHHKDRNRKNADKTNLEVLCANCHAIEHYGE